MRRTLIGFLIIVFAVPCFAADYQEQRDENNVLTGYLRTIDNANIPLANGNADYQTVFKWIGEGNVPDSDSSVLFKVKKAKAGEYRVEGLRRIRLQAAEWDTYTRVAFIASMWNMLGTPSVAQTQAKDIYVYVKNTAIPNVNAQITIAAVQAIDVISDVSWP